MWRGDGLQNGAQIAIQQRVVRGDDVVCDVCDSHQCHRSITSSMKESYRCELMHKTTE